MSQPKSHQAKPDNPDPNDFQFNNFRQRLQIRDFCGRKFTLSPDPIHWRLIKDGSKNFPVIILGLGAGDPADLPFLENASQIYWLEEENFLKLRLSKNLQTPLDWIRLSIEDLEKLINNIPNKRIYFYWPALRYAPVFWGSILAKVNAKILAENRKVINRQKKLFWLPGSDNQLLHQELKHTLINFGQENILETVKPELSDFKNISFILSINFRGLNESANSDGSLFYLARELNIPVAIWLADNPWHILSSISLPWWKDAHIFITDKSFITPLKKSGAKYVYECPLACAPHMWQELDASRPSVMSGRPLFVGRSVFPEYMTYFSGVSLDSELWQQALNIFETNPDIADLPNFHWWIYKLAVQPWPGLAVRKAGLGADKASALNRSRWINSAIAFNLEIIGDNGWQKLLPKALIKPPVDYYGSLRENYALAQCVLNVTSLLIPQSLSQRHFDVWAAGGFLLTDATQGLEIFPSDLVKNISLEKPDRFEQKFNYFKSHPKERYDLIVDWRKIIKKKHTYLNRLEFIFDTVNK